MEYALKSIQLDFLARRKMKMNKDIDKLVDELDDFDLSEASYQVWGFWLDDEEQVLKLLKDKV